MGRRDMVWGRSKNEADWHSARVSDGPRCTCEAWYDHECACGAMSVPDTAVPVCGSEGFELGDDSARLPIDTNAVFGPVCAACARLEGLSG